MARSNNSYIRLIDDNVDDMSSDAYERLLKNLKDADIRSCNEDAVSTYNLLCDIEQYCYLTESLSKEDYDANIKSIREINNRFGEFIATSELYTSDKNAADMSRSSDVGVGEIISRNSRHYSNALGYAIDSPSDNIKEGYHEFVTDRLLYTINDVIKKYPEQKDSLAYTMAERERYVKELIQIDLQNQAKDMYFHPNFDYEEVRDRIIQETNSDPNESYDNLPAYVTERLREEAGIDSAAAYKEPWKIKYDYSEHTPYFPADREDDVLAHKDKYENLLVKMGPESYLEQSFGPIMSADIEFKAINGETKRVELHGDTRELKQSSPLADLISRSEYAGQISLADHEAFNVLQVRRFDNWERYDEASKDGFKSYDAEHGMLHHGEEEKYDLQPEGILEEKISAQTDKSDPEGIGGAVKENSEKSETAKDTNGLMYAGPITQEVLKSEQVSAQADKSDPKGIGGAIKESSTEIQQMLDAKQGAVNAEPSNQYISAEIEWSDNNMPAGKTQISEYAGEFASVGELLDMHGFSTRALMDEKQGLHMNILRVRKFDSFEDYDKARRDGFRTYDEQHPETKVGSTSKEVEEQKKQSLVERLKGQIKSNADKAKDAGKNEMNGPKGPNN